MKLITYLIYTLLAFYFIGCNPKHDKRGMRAKKIEMKDSLKTLHPDSIIKYRGKKRAKKKDCCKACACKDTINN